MRAAPCFQVGFGTGVWSVCSDPAGKNAADRHNVEQIPSALHRSDSDAGAEGLVHALVSGKNSNWDQPVAAGGNGHFNGG